MFRMEGKRPAKKSLECVFEIIRLDKMKQTVQTEQIVRIYDWKC